MSFMFSPAIHCRDRNAFHPPLPLLFRLNLPFEPPQNPFSPLNIQLKSIKVLHLLLKVVF